MARSRVVRDRRSPGALRDGRRDALRAARRVFRVLGRSARSPVLAVAVTDLFDSGDRLAQELVADAPDRTQLRRRWRELERAFLTAVATGLRTARDALQSVSEEEPGRVPLETVRVERTPRVMPSRRPRGTARRVRRRPRRAL